MGNVVFLCVFGVFCVCLKVCKNLNLVCFICARERVLCVRERVFFLCGAVVCDGV